MYFWDILPIVETTVSTNGTWLNNKRAWLITIRYDSLLSEIVNSIWLENETDREEYFCTKSRILWQTYCCSIYYNGSPVY